MITDYIYLICSLITTILCIILKIPQLISISKTKSSVGISMQSLVLEFWAYVLSLLNLLTFKLIKLEFHTDIQQCYPILTPILTHYQYTPNIHYFQLKVFNRSYY